MSDLKSIACVVCESKFTPRHEHDFICQPCRAALKCRCGSDDVVMDWDVSVDDGCEPYRWTIECGCCGRAMSSAWANLVKHDQDGKDLHAAWVAWQLDAPPQA